MAAVCVYCGGGKRMPARSRRTGLRVWVPCPHCTPKPQAKKKEDAA